MELTNQAGIVEAPTITKKMSTAKKTKRFQLLYGNFLTFRYSMLRIIDFNWWLNEIV